MKALAFFITLFLLLSLKTTLLDSQTRSEALTDPFGTWSAERRTKVDAQMSPPIIELLIFTGPVDTPQTHQEVVAEARRIFPLIEVQDDMRDKPGGEDRQRIIFALRQLAKLTRGIVQLANGELSISGQAQDAREFADETWPKNVAVTAPAGLRLGKVDVLPPTLRNFPWSITKTTNEITFDGFAPSVGAKAELTADAEQRFPGKIVSDKTVVALGAPENFVAAAKVGLHQLEYATAGTASISGPNYSILAGLPSKGTTIYKGIDTTATYWLPTGFTPNKISVVYTPPAVDTHTDARSIDFMYVTNRVREDTGLTVSFNAERAEQLTFGVARVHVPEDHKIGNIELPGEKHFLLWTYGKEPADQDKHFIIKSIEILDRGEWKRLAAERGRGEGALIFVHGYNTSFEDAVFRTAQIIWDLQYKGAAILFSWPSRGGTFGTALYEYDRNSALIARAHFIDVLKLLEQEAGVSRVNIIAHSMGDFLALDALYNYYRFGDPIAIAELVMAAPDVDRDQYLQEIPDLRHIASGMTLYASSADKAMFLSRTVAQAPRAGDVLSGKPTLVEGVDAIDVTAVGDELFGVNHDTFASNRSLIDDIDLLLRGIRPPNSRLAEIRSVPEGANRPTYWRYVP